jgi:hypothetical protein
MEKAWYKSKGKIGAALLTVSAVAGAVGAYLTGAMDASTLIQTIMGIGAGLGIWGVRDAEK